MQAGGAGIAILFPWTLCKLSHYFRGGELSTGTKGSQRIEDQNWIAVSIQTQVAKL